jgi:glucose/mannose-6-phosphate isomerase
MNLIENDKNNMLDVLKNFPEQVREACKIGEQLVDIDNTKSDKILVLGMGGSAIGGDLLRNYLSNLKGGKHIQIIINRDYSIPEFIDNDWLVIVSSYSGNTEETLSAFNLALDLTKNIIGITTGGKLERMLNLKNLPVIKLPGGLQPRAAIGYSFFPMLYLLMLNGTIKNEGVEEIAKSINKLIPHLEEKCKSYSIEDEYNNAYIIARNIFKRIPLIYSSTKYEVVNLRWRGQFQENSNIPSFGNILPEMNHNEINCLDSELLGNFYSIVIKDNDENERVEKRFQFLIDLFKSNDRKYAEINPENTYTLTKYFELIYLGDWISYWVALMRGEDPTEIKNIMNLKEYMA